MPHHKSNSDTEMRIKEERKRTNPWVKWSLISGCLASFAIIISCLPTIGQYCSHIGAVWHAPEQVSEVKTSIANLQSQQTVIQEQVQETRDDVRDIKHFLYRQISPVGSVNKTNLNYE